MSTANYNRFSSQLDAIVDWAGRGIAWLTIAMVLVMFTVVLLRFVFGLGWVWMQEIVNYLHAYIFMIGAAYTLRHDSHVRVDIFYRDLSDKGKARIDLLGTVFLLFPVCGFIFFASWNEVISSWQNLEPSQRTDGLSFAYVLKTSMLLMPGLLILQGIAIVIKSWLRMSVPTGPGQSKPEHPEKQDG